MKFMKKQSKYWRRTGWKRRMKRCQLVMEANPDSTLEGTICNFHLVDLNLAEGPLVGGYDLRLRTACMLASSQGQIGSVRVRAPHRVWLSYGWVSVALRRCQGRSFDTMVENKGACSLVDGMLGFGYFPWWRMVWGKKEGSIDCSYGLSEHGVLYFVFSCLVIEYLVPQSQSMLLGSCRVMYVLIMIRDWFLVYCNQEKRKMRVHCSLDIRVCYLLAICL